MSGASAAIERPEHDFYPTPPWPVRLILGELPCARVVLDPCAGDGAILRVARDAWGCEAIGYDVDPERLWGNPPIDALALDRWHEADLILTNPPFRLAREFVDRALAEAAPRRATVAMLLRLAFLASKGRAALHQDRPSDVYVLGERPSFTKDGATDRYDYAWFVWGPFCGGRWKVLT